MFQPVNWFIGLRYSQSRSRTGFVSFITFFSIAGILLGVASLITVVSVMNGFENELKTRVLGLVPHITVETQLNDESLRQDLLALPEVARVTPLEETEALVQSATGMSGILIQGINPSLEQDSIIASHMIAGSLADLAPSKYQLVIGQALARQLNVTIGDKMRLILPSRTMFTPMGRVPMQRNFTIAGVFNLGSQVDDTVVYLHHSDARKIMRKRSGDEQLLRVYLHDAFDVSLVTPKLLAKWPNLELATWQQSQGTLFSAVKMEKNMMWLMLGLIVAVAAFNIVSALVMVVNDKQGEISILQTMGMDKSGIIQIFITQGMVNGAWGVVLGTALGLLLTVVLNPMLAVFGINIFGAGYVSQTLPIVLAWQDVGIIVIGAFIMSFIATLYPAYRASQTLPAEVLRNE
ncbi:lipoprotein-releasing ABC transporter permease subunit [Thalassotalea euphylliae]|uniref:Lipoprotein-releasing ABC transporter permease subunit n=1 Tax=Thalassotalea euphylliae TaxID=1655234 RepID=A0A3E0UHC1_9GAMM|nr:lipoprotein-releasing ABC transporter permease subunit [Thalassotalea euphylliae]REL36279.1 lipoprotein-releasing ABC transporter permease subunit [Thalassotalea euphylliae]